MLFPHIGRVGHVDPSFMILFAYVTYLTCFSELYIYICVLNLCYPLCGFPGTFCISRTPGIRWNEYFHFFLLTSIFNVILSGATISFGCIITFALGYCCWC